MNKPEWFEAVDASKSDPKSVNSSGARTSRFVKRFAIVGVAALMAGGGVAFATANTPTPASATTNTVTADLDAVTPSATPTATPSATPTATSTPDPTTVAVTPSPQPTISGGATGDDDDAVQGDDQSDVNQSGDNQSGDNQSGDNSDSADVNIDLNQNAVSQLDPNFQTGAGWNPSGSSHDGNGDD
jgi:hypothetical protein